MWRRERWVGVAYILPAFFVLGLVLFFPYLFAAYLSFNRVSPLLETTYAGLANFARALQDRVFLIGVQNTLVLVLFSQIIAFVLALSGAMALRERTALNSVIRVVLLIPWAIPGVVTALTWKWILDGHFGILNQLLASTGIVDRYVSWLASPDYALGAVIIVNVWRSYPFTLLMLLAGLQAIPDELYEAAAIDGASPWQRFAYITLPIMRPVIAITIILTAIWDFKTFDLVWILTGGGPGYATEILPTLIYKTAFSRLDFGYASAIALLMALIMIVPISIYIRSTTRTR